MATFKSNFDSKKFMKELEKEIKKSVESDLKKHPEKVLNDHIGDVISTECKSCGNAEMVVARGGNVRCPKFGYTAKASLVPNWR